LKRFISFVRDWAHSHASVINQNAVKGTVFAEAEISSGYLFILNVANLIALCGLLLNSSPVIIGAMLISPLMGPILSFGFAFVTGDRAIWKMSVRKIILSVLLTVLVAAIAAFLSPLKDLTGEIVARTKPNLYDLIIAFLAGIAGASALCTKKSYLTIVPGVAIATAVIPPLSVTGYGLGTTNITVLSGGFLLFFTNFVAIILSTCIVFYFYGFRPGMDEVADLPRLKKRFAYLLSVLLIISIPLVYTLRISISEVREKALVQKTLRSELDMENRSRLVTFSYNSIDSGMLQVNALVNTVNYMSDIDIAQAENRLEKTLGRKIKLNVEQVKVQAGGLREQPGVPAPAATVRSPGDITRDTVENVKKISGYTREKIDRLIAPSTITDFSVTMTDSSDRVSMNLSIQRDSPFSPEETLWLERIITSEVGKPVDLFVKTSPFIPPLRFKPGETAITDEMKRTILKLKDINGRNGNIRVTVHAVPEYKGRAAMQVARKRIDNIVSILERECNIPGQQITTAIDNVNGKSPIVRVSISAATR
jgi:uncharacterized hydrophobic protein (TIGR00271 family)